jgi:serine/alanine adding enzyme
VDIVRQLDEQRWREFVENTPQSQIFHTPEMFQVFANTQNHKPEVWAATENGGQQVLALLLPVRVTLMNGLLRSFTSRSIAYGSVLYDPGLAGQEALTLLLKTYGQQMSKTSLFTELRNLSDLTAVQPILNNYGFVYEDHLNYLIDLDRPAEQIWQSVKSEVRTNVRKARKQGVVVEEAATVAELQAGYAVLEDVYKRVQVPLAPVSLFESAFELLHPRNKLQCFLARVEGVYAGVAMRLLHKGIIYAWYAGVKSEYASYKVQDLLNWHVLEWGAARGYKLFDFGGAGKPDQEYGPRRYKAKFNGHLVNYGRNICIHSPLKLKLSQASYQFYRRYRYKQAESAHVDS